MKLNLGCGKNFIPGFVHVDLDDYPHIDYRSDVGDLSFLSSDSAELIYASHVLEYFDTSEALSVLKEWHRVLKSGGILRIAVPDFEAIIKVYQKYKDLNHQGILGPLYGRWPYKADNGTDAIFYHKSTYDYESLNKILVNVGYSNISRYNWKNTIHKNHDDYSQAYIPHMDKDNGILISLNIEAEKL